MKSGEENCCPLVGLRRVTEGGMVKVAVMLLLVFITTVNGLSAEFVSPHQPTNTLPGAGAEVKVTLEPLTKFDCAGLRLTVPAPVTRRFKEKFPPASCAKRAPTVGLALV